ncbi:hypothetical protein GCM10010346_62070 [Streptomyces chryseus]|uniref:Uncharacterized protein n=1 Tax=Streptomyces chryseus TaxID=68186 RepID=A0ABQ3ED09_9ACTN|nr:hypothetical protein GCM10010346_62070 [Streptomyces chryseus]
MRQPTGIPGTKKVGAGLDRRAAALVLRDWAMQVPGVQSAQDELTPVMPDQGTATRSCYELLLW